MLALISVLISAITHALLHALMVKKQKKKVENHLKKKYEIIFVCAGSSGTKDGQYLQIKCINSLIFVTTLCLSNFPFIYVFFSY